MFPLATPLAMDCPEKRRDSRWGKVGKDRVEEERKKGEKDNRSELKGMALANSSLFFICSGAYFDEINAIY